MTRLHPAWRVTAATLLAGLVVTAAPAAAAAEPPTVVAHAGDGGVHHAGSGFDTGFTKPSRLFLRVRVEPNKTIEIDWDVYCRRGKRGKGDHGTIRTRTDGHIPLPIPLADPRSCLVYAFGTYDNERFDRRVHFRMTLFARGPLAGGPAETGQPWTGARRTFSIGLPFASSSTSLSR
jgi:hypothetical protein